MLSNDQISKMLSAIQGNINKRKTAIKLSDQTEIMNTIQSLIEQNEALNAQNEKLQKASKASNSRNTSSSSFSVNTLRAIWMLVQTRDKLLFVNEHKDMLPSLVFYSQGIEETKALFSSDHVIDLDINESINKSFWRFSTDFGKSGSQLGSLHNFGLSWIGFEGKLSKRTGISLEIFTQSSFDKYNKKGDIEYSDIEARREKIIEFLSDDRCKAIENVRSFCNAISKDIEFEMLDVQYVKPSQPKIEQPKIISNVDLLSELYGKFDITDILQDKNGIIEFVMDYKESRFLHSEKDNIVLLEFRNGKCTISIRQESEFKYDPCSINTHKYEILHTNGKPNGKGETTETFEYEDNKALVKYLDNLFYKIWIDRIKWINETSYV